MTIQATKVETSACQLAKPEKTCPTKIMEQMERIDELSRFIMGDATPHTFKVDLLNSTTKTFFEREVKVVCYGFSVELDWSEAQGKWVPKITDIKGEKSLTFRVNVDEPKYARDTVQLKSILKAMNKVFFGQDDKGEPRYRVFTLDDSLNIITDVELANAVNPAALDLAEPLLSYIKSRN